MSAGAHERAHIEVVDHALADGQCLRVDRPPATPARLRGLHGAEDRLGFVDERDVGVGPVGVGDVGRAGPVQQILLGR